MLKLKHLTALAVIGIVASTPATARKLVHHRVVTKTVTTYTMPAQQPQVIVQREPVYVPVPYRQTVQVPVPQPYPVVYRQPVPVPQPYPVVYRQPVVAAYPALLPVRYPVGYREVYGSRAILTGGLGYGLGFGTFRQHSGFHRGHRH